MSQRDVGAHVRVDLAEIDDHVVELLPHRAALSGLVNITTVVPINLAIAVNAATIGSNATAYALQGVVAVR
jgi:hypothetical protein